MSLNFKTEVYVMVDDSDWSFSMSLYGGSSPTYVPMSPNPSVKQGG